MLDNTGIGLGIVKNDVDNKHYVVMQVDQANISVAITLASQDNYEQPLDALIEGLKKIKGDMRGAASGLILVKDVPDGYSPVPAKEGRRVQRPRSSGKQGTRPTTR